MEPSSWNVVIVDDEPDSIGVVETILRFKDANVRTAPSGLAGLTLLRQQRPTFLILDIQMPHMSGWEVLDTIRKDEQLKDLPVIAISAHAMLADRSQMLAKGFNGTIGKPISAFTLIDQIQGILQTLARPAQGVV
ncbi:MAG: response regulator [Aggregatilineales bacterium]